MIRPALTGVLHPVDPERARVYLAACAAQGYGPLADGGPLRGDIAAILGRLRQETGMTELLPRWVTEPDPAPEPTHA